MARQATSLGTFIAELMGRHQHSNRSLAAAAGISEGAVRNLLKYGVEKNAKDPDARTLYQVANALGVSPLRLYRLAGYLPPTPDAFSLRAGFVAEVFDKLPPDNQEVILAMLDAMAQRADVRQVVQAIKADASNPLAGFDLYSPQVIRLFANRLIIMYDMTEAADLDRIEPEAQLFHYTWKALPVSTQQRVKGLIRHKLALDYDPTMVDPEWRA